MNHIHNEIVLVFFKEHQDNLNVQGFLKKQDKEIAEMNKALGTKYQGYLNYLEANIGDDASFTMEELKVLLRPKFEIMLNTKEKKEFQYENIEISISELNIPVYIKDEVI